MGAGGAASTGLRLVGAKNFVRHNPRSDKFEVLKFHHVEFWASDATNTWKRRVRRRRAVPGAQLGRCGHPCDDLKWASVAAAGSSTVSE
jgi:hypothetical protein